jgi:hypothetical protein
MCDGSDCALPGPRLLQVPTQRTTDFRCDLDDDIVTARIETSGLLFSVNQGRPEDGSLSGDECVVTVRDVCTVEIPCADGCVDARRAGNRFRVGLRCVDFTCSDQNQRSVGLRGIQGGTPEFEFDCPYP